MIEKKSVLFVSFAGVLLFFISAFSKEIGICPPYDYSYCSDVSNQLAELLIPFFVLLILVLGVYWAREGIYQSWFRFARWAIPLALLIIFITPEYGGGLFNPIQKGSVAFALTALFFIISVLIILIKYFRLKY